MLQQIYLSVWITGCGSGKQEGKGKKGGGKAMVNNWLRVSDYKRSHRGERKRKRGGNSRAGSHYWLLASYDNEEEGKEKEGKRKFLGYAIRFPRLTGRQKEGKGGGRARLTGGIPDCASMRREGLCLLIVNILLQHPNKGKGERGNYSLGHQDIVIACIFSAQGGKGEGLSYSTTILYYYGNKVGRKGGEKEEKERRGVTSFKYNILLFCRRDSKKEEGEEEEKKSLNK